MHIVISYSKTRDAVQSLAQDLEAPGHTVCFDQALIGGQDWWPAILEQVRNSKLFVFALAPSPLEWGPCQLEYGYLGALNKRILPVLIQALISALPPPLLSRIRFVDYRRRTRRRPLP